MAERNHRDPAVRPAQFLQAQPAEGAALPPGMRRITVFPRGDVPVSAQVISVPERNQTIAVIPSGVNVNIEGVTLPEGVAMGLGDLGVIDISANRVVLWTSGVDQLDLQRGQLQSGNLPLEIYMEGDIIFRQAERVIYADRMYYDVANRVGTVLKAEMLTPVPQYEGLLRLRAEALQQLGRDRFFAQNASITSSRLGVPRYRLEAGSVEFQDRQQPRTDPVTGAPLLDPENRPLVDHQSLLTSQNNVIYLEDFPVFYWPYIATDLTEPSYFIRRVRLRSDSVFGQQILTDWNLYQLLGIRNRPEGTDWGLSLDYMSDRGFGHGTTFAYSRHEGFFGTPGPTAGLIDYWGIADKGNDNLGLDRRSVPAERDYRYRLFGQHRQMLEGDWQLSAEVGWIERSKLPRTVFRARVGRDEGPGHRRRAQADPR